jgi:hypothetical protein
MDLELRRDLLEYALIPFIYLEYTFMYAYKYRPSL